jgi:hypothetical protein
MKALNIAALALSTALTVGCANVPRAGTEASIDYHLEKCMSYTPLKRAEIADSYRKEVQSDPDATPKDRQEVYDLLSDPVGVCVLYAFQRDGEAQQTQAMLRRHSMHRMMGMDHLRYLRTPQIPRVRR